MADDTVTVLSKRYFRGEAGEGTNGMVAPGDELQVTRSRAADLKINGLVDTVSDAAPDAPLAAQITASESEAPASAAKAAPILTPAPAAKAADAKK